MARSARRPTRRRRTPLAMHAERRAAELRDAPGRRAGAAQGRDEVADPLARAVALLLAAREADPDVAARDLAEALPRHDRDVRLLEERFGEGLRRVDASAAARRRPEAARDVG